jgi:plastocyanin
MKTTPVAAAGLLMLVAACSGSSDTTSSPSTPSSAPTATSSEEAGGGGADITIKGFRYTPLQVAPGTTITVTNQDDAEHTVTSDTKGQFDSGDADKGEPVTFKAPTSPGTYQYHCKYHASMHGSISVT